MTFSTSRSQRIEIASVAVFCLAILTSLWQPALHWPLWLGIAVLVVPVFLRGMTDTAADRARRSRSLWTIPLVILAVAVQLVYFARPEDRNYTIALAILLAFAGAALFFGRRRA